MILSSVKMEVEATSGDGGAQNPTPSYILEASACLLSEKLIFSVGAELEANKRQLAQALSFSPHCHVTNGLFHWCHSPGSTVFVLVCVLNNLGRADCVRRILQYMEMHTMQLFVKVEEMGSEAGPYVSSPKFQQVTTNCEFTLVQALENILGGDLTHYEIVGPGSWVKWNTLAKELKGQQLTLRHFSRPVPHTRMALYGPGEFETELRRPVTLTPNIPANINVEYDEETHLKEADHTRMDNLKLPTSGSMSDSNNVTNENSLDDDNSKSEYGLPESVRPEGPSKSFRDLSLDSFSKNDEFTLDSQTRAKVPISWQNTMDQAPQDKVLLDKVLYSENSNLEGKLSNTKLTSASPIEVLNNVPALSLLQQGFSSVMDNDTSSQTHYKACIESHHGKEAKQNNLNFVSVTAHQTRSSFIPNSLDTQEISIPCDTYTVTSPKGTNQPKQVIVIRPESRVLPAAFKDESYSSSTDSAMNSDTSCHSSLPSDPEIIGPTSTASQQSHFMLMATDTGQPASSMFSFNKNTQHINVGMLPCDVDYVPHNCIQDVNSQTPAVSASVESSPRTIPQVSGAISSANPPTPCGSPGHVTPPQKRHRSSLGPMSSSSSPSGLSPQQQLQLQHHQQQQELLRRQESEKQLLEERHQQQWMENMASRISPGKLSDPSAIEREDQEIHFQQQQLMMYPQQQQQQHQLQLQQQLQLQLQQEHLQQRNPTSQAPSTLAQQSTSIGQQPPLASRQIQSWSYQSHDHQSALQRFHSQPQQHTQQYLQQHTQEPSRLDLTTQPSLITHTPPPSFPDEDQLVSVQRLRSGSEPVNHFHMQSGTEVSRLFSTPSQLLPRTGLQQTFQTQYPNAAVFSHPQNSPTSLSSSLDQRRNSSPVQNLSMVAPHHTMTADNRNPQQYLAMHQPNPSRNPSGISPLVRTEQQIPVGVTHRQQQPSLPGLEFRVRVPQLSHGSIPPEDPRFVMNVSPSHSRRSSGASDKSGFAEGATSHAPPPHTSRLAGAAAAPVCPQPFKPAPPVTLPLRDSSKSLASSLSQQSRGSPSTEIEDSNSDEELRYNYIDNSQVADNNSLQRASIEEELTVLPGWCETENGDTIKNTMQKYQSKDGSYIIWKSRRHNKFVLTVSHLNELIHFRVEEGRNDNNRTVYYLFSGGFKSESLLELINHYQEKGIPTAVQLVSGSKRYNEHIRLRYPLKVRLERRRETTRSK